MADYHGRHEPDQEQLRRGWVHGVNPLTVRFDGESTGKKISKVMGGYGGLLVGDEIIASVIQGVTYFVSKVAGDTGWIVPTLGSGFTNFGSGWADASYRRINGIVWIRGPLVPSTTTVGEIAWTLPDGFKPQLRLTFMNYAYDGTNPSIGRMDVLANGQVQRIHPAVATGIIFLDNISFPAAYAGD